MQRAIRWNLLGQAEELENPTERIRTIQDSRADLMWTCRLVLIPSLHLALHLTSEADILVGDTKRASVYPNLVVESGENSGSLTLRVPAMSQYTSSVPVGIWCLYILFGEDERDCLNFLLLSINWSPALLSSLTHLRIRVVYFIWDFEMLISYLSGV